MTGKERVWAVVSVVLVMVPLPCPAVLASSAELFILPLTHQNFSFWDLDHEISYQASLHNLPDLPSWLHYSYAPSADTGFIYGSPPPGLHNFELEVVAWNRDTYETAHRVFRVDVVEEPRKTFLVQFKVKNLDVEDLLKEEVRARLTHVISSDLWLDMAPDLNLTSITSATQHGDRLPVDPNAPKGVYVSYGSSHQFSEHLLQLEKEVEPLWDHQPCPSYFKKTSYERFFQQGGFAIDWCSFKLVHKEKGEQGGPEAVQEAARAKLPVISALEEEGGVQLLRRDQVVKRSYTFDVVHTILVPLVVMLALLALLTLAMCCHRSHMLPRGQDIQMVQYASIQRATEALRTLKGREHSPHPSTATTTTQVDTLTRSHTASPSSTLPRNSTLSRRFEDYATLSRPDPPPYQRNGTTPTR